MTYECVNKTKICIYLQREKPTCTQTRQKLKNLILLHALSPCNTASGGLLIIFKVAVKQFTWFPPHLSTHFGQN